MLMRDDLGVLLLGAREAVYAVDSNDISVKKAAVSVRRFEDLSSNADVVAGLTLIFNHQILMFSPHFVLPYFSDYKSQCQQTGLFS